MTKLTTERLEYYAALPTAPVEGEGFFKKGIFMYEVRRMARQLLAYEQAAEKPYGYLEPCDFPRTTATVYPEKDKYAFMPLYAAPVLPKQPEPVVLYMGRELISKEGLELIRDGVSEATQLESMCMASAILGGGYPAQPVIPDHSGDNLPCPFCGGEVDVSGWRGSNGNSGPECNECGATASNLSDWNKRTAQPVSEPYKLPQGWIKGQFAYQDLFNAIGAAVVSKHPSIEISVKAFEDSMLAAAPAQESE